MTTGFQFDVLPRHSAKDKGGGPPVGGAVAVAQAASEARSQKEEVETQPLALSFPSIPPIFHHGSVHEIIGKSAAQTNSAPP